ncbi:MAG: STAS domain-containing protein [Acidobacteriia bacterium]|nr:STAS domain-containing protein [Terriglobia bacterium]
MPGSKIRQVEPNLTVVELSGHLNLGNELMTLESAVKRLIEEGARKLVIDVTRLDYIDSAGIGMLVGCNGQMDRAGGKMRVAGAHSTVAKAFEVVHMGRIMALDADVDTAVKNLTAGSAGA